jgi:leader peptidase (prepilin peptidase)/N-methyltransferase
VELATAILFAGFSVTLEGKPLILLKYLFLISLLVAISFIDLEHYLIPNEMIITGLIGGIGFNLAAGDLNLLQVLVGTLIPPLLFLLLALASRGGMGMGDVKLGAVLGLFLGWPRVMEALFLGCLLAGAVALGLLITRRLGRKDPIPLGPFLATGTIVTLFWGPQLWNWYAAFFFR